MLRPSWSAEERGTGLLSTVLGVAVLMAMLGFVVNVALGLWTRSTVDAVAHDVAREVATAPEGADLGVTGTDAIERSRRLLGVYGADVEMRFESFDSDGNVVLHVTAPGVSLLPRLIEGGPVIGSIDRRIVVRREGA